MAIKAIDQLNQRVRGTIREYNPTFWTLVAGSFVDHLGGALIWPFFTLYVTAKFGVNMTTVGLLFGLYAVSDALGGMIGGALADRFGRKTMMIIGLIFSATTSVLMGVIGDFHWFFAASLIVGTVANIGHPAQNAMVSDLVEEEKRASAYAIMRVAFNLAVAIGPSIGGLLATRVGYLTLFLTDAVTSTLMAIVVLVMIPETKPEALPDEPKESLAQTFAGYVRVLKHRAFVWFLVIGLLVTTVYIQMNTTLAVFLRDVHGVNEQGWGWILTLNAAMVVLFQIGLTRRLEKFRPMIMLAVGSLLYAIGYAMYGFANVYGLFLLAMAIITIGEMVVVPVAQKMVADFAPEDMRGRYMAAHGFTWTVGFALAPMLAGLVMDNTNPLWLWYIVGALGLIGAAGYLLLEGKVAPKSSEEIPVELSETVEAVG